MNKIAIVKPLTPYAKLKAELASAQHESHVASTALLLALTHSPDYTVTVRDDQRASYRITAYGLGRCDGGYLTVRFHHHGQTDHVTGHSVEDWLRTYGQSPFFAIVASNIRIAQHNALYPPQAAQVSA